jgi:hypothetical protein
MSEATMSVASAGTCFGKLCRSQAALPPAENKAGRGRCLAVKAGLEVMLQVANHKLPERRKSWSTLKNVEVGIRLNVFFQARQAGQRGRQSIMS